jgi:biotin carboxyl carrier protein
MSQYRITIGNEEIETSITKDGPIYEVKLDDKSYRFKLQEQNSQWIIFQNLENQRRVRLPIYTDANKNFWLQVNGKVAQIAAKKSKRGKKSSSSQDGQNTEVYSPMPGKIFKLLKKEGEQVKMGETILILEAMKMEHPVKAMGDGPIKKIHFKEGEQVQFDDLLVELAGE